jgi:hypothetical protein
MRTTCTVLFGLLIACCSCSKEDPSPEVAAAPPTTPESDSSPTFIPSAEALRHRAMLDSFVETACSAESPPVAVAIGPFFHSIVSFCERMELGQADRGEERSEPVSLGTIRFRNHSISVYTGSLYTVESAEGTILGELLTERQFAQDLPEVYETFKTLWATKAYADCRRRD